MKTQQLLNELAYYVIHEDMEQFYKTEQRIERYDTKQDNKRVKKEEDFK